MDVLWFLSCCSEGISLVHSLFPSLGLYCSSFSLNLFLLISWHLIARLLVLFLSIATGYTVCMVCVYRLLHKTPACFTLENITAQGIFLNFNLMYILFFWLWLNVRNIFGKFKKEMDLKQSNVCVTCKSLCTVLHIPYVLQGHWWFCY